MTEFESEAEALNAICPYFTMFPIEFPRRIIHRYAKKGQKVLDPFCGRGTTNFAARLAGLESLGVDSSPVAVAITKAKLASSNHNRVVRTAKDILVNVASRSLPKGDFWSLAFHEDTLRDICRIRSALLENCSSESRTALRGVMLGALHGPVQKTFPSYLSNQCPRTFAPKPRYAVKFWSKRKLKPLKVDVLQVIRHRARRFYGGQALPAVGSVRLADSRELTTFQSEADREKFDWVITSPPYYGMRTYVQDQWIRNWFLGGPAEVDYRTNGQLDHLSPDVFAQQLSKVWLNVANACRKGARMVIRFGGIRDRNVDPMDILRRSMDGTPWRLTNRFSAGSSRLGKRQADQFLPKKSPPLIEYDVWATI